MKKLLFWTVLFCLFTNPLISATVYSPVSVIPASKPVPNEIFLKKISSMKIKDLQKLAGRKFTLKEKIGFLVLKHKIKHQSDRTQGKGQTAFTFGIVGLALLAIGLFVPYVILGSLLASIFAIAIGSSASKKDPADQKARTGKLLGWIGLGLTVLILILAVVVIASFFNAL